MSSKQNLSRRKFFAYFSSIGFTSTLFPKILWAKFQEQDEKIISKIMLQEAEKIAGLEFTDEERELMLEGVNDYLEAYDLIEEGTSSWDDEEVSGTGEVCCSHCDKKFRVDVDTQITFSTNKI